MAPNPIDFDKVWAGLTSIGETKNFVVLATLCTIFGLYIVTVVFARRADRNDKQKVRNKATLHYVNNCVSVYVRNVTLNKQTIK